VVLVACLDQKHDPRGGSFSTCFPGFDDLDRVIEGATLAYAPAFAAPEATERFLARLRPEADETTRRLLYVALTRARNRLIVEWPQDDGADEPPFPITARRLMDEHGALSLGANSVELGGQSFSAKVHALEAALPPCFGEDAADLAGADKREPRFAVIEQAIEPAIVIVSPSKALETVRVMPVALTTTQVAPGWRVEGEELSLATDKGTAIHEALRILLLRPDLNHRVAAHCRLSNADVEALERQAQGLAKALAELGYPDLHVEQPLEIALNDGGTLNAIIDLIAEGPEGYLIVDHKSGAVDDHAQRMATYWPQLAAYAEAVEAAGKKPVKGTSIFWTDTGELTLATIAGE
jgi:hypothetical protein